MREPDIFVDDRINVGQDWVNGLGEHLATSKIMVAIFSGDYFGSDWCLHELDLMLARATKTKNLIVPVIVHDGDKIPQPAQRIQPTDMAKFRNTHLNEDSPDYAEFSKAMGLLAPQVAKLIDAAPNFKKVWIEQHQKRFNDVYQASIQKQPLEPTQFKAMRPVPPKKAPSLILTT